MWHALVLSAICTTHTLSLPQETIEYTTTFESGEVSSIAYTKEGVNRPITFAFNGGPGSSSVWLHMGTLGPRRIEPLEDGQSLLPPYQIVDNPETILDLTDLVFIDPMDTGLSQNATEEEKTHFSVKKDIEAVGTFIRDYLTKHKRWNCPKYIAGESYGAIRAAGLAQHLQDEYGIFLNGIILVSAAVDYQTLIFEKDNPLPYLLFLPTYATTAWYHNRYRPGASIEQVAKEARDFVYETYAPSLLCRNCFDLEPIYQTVAEMTSLPLSVVRRYKGRVSDGLFFSEFLAHEQKLIGRFDSRDTGLSNSFYHDPSAQVIGVYSAAFHHYLHTELNCVESYKIFSSTAHSKWDYWDYNFWGYPNLMEGLRSALTVCPSMKVFVGCGYFDLATPFATVEYCLDHLDVPNSHIQVEYYEGGHMYYFNPKARVKFKQDLIRFYR